MAAVEERFIEIQPNASDHKKEDPYNLTMAECLPSDLYFAISRVNEDEDYGDYDEDDDDFPPELYFLGVIGGQDYDDDQEFPYNLSMVECLGSDLHFAIFEDNKGGDEVDFGMKEVCHAKASSGRKSMGPIFEVDVVMENNKNKNKNKNKKNEDVAEYVEKEEVDEEEEENFWYGWYKICKFKRAKQRSRASYMKIKNRSSFKN